MADVVVFRPRAELDAAANLRRFVELCRDQLTVFGANLAFDDNVWDVTDALALRGRRYARHLLFTTWAPTSENTPTSMAEPFCSFAKAYLRYQHGVRPTKTIDFTLVALRAVEAALTENGGEALPVHIHADVLNRAAQLAKDRFSRAGACQVGIQLQMLAKFLLESRLTEIPVQWRNPLKRPNPLMRVGPEFDRRRQQKLPSPAALDAMAYAFRVATEPSDILVCSIAAILCSAPQRINEVLELPVDCEVTQRQVGRDELAYGLRWWPSKGADPQVKWIIPSMADVVREALARIRRHTQEARRIARWYEHSPRRIFLPAHLERLRTRDLLSMPEVGEVLFVDTIARSTPLQWCKQHQVATVKQSRQAFVRFDDVEKAVLALLPRGLPFLNAARDLKYSEALCVLQRNTMHLTHARYRCVITPMSHGDVHDRLGGSSKMEIRSVFDRLGLYEPDGTPIRVTTHQFRHYLNTLAQAGGMSQLDIAKWSGRKDIRQNAAYDHVSDRDVVAQLRDAVGDEHRMFGPLATLYRTTLIPRDEFARLKIPTAHTTEVGFCVHDYTMSPCQLHRDCFHCEELICIKGDAVKTAAIRGQYEETQALLVQAQAATAQQCAGANRWMEHQRETLERLDQLCKILDDPQIPDGTFIQLSAQKQTVRSLPAPSLTITDARHTRHTPGASSAGADDGAQT
jgi:hypothetical protein